MAKIHIMSDLNLGLNEHSNPDDEVLPAGCDLVVFSGNLARHQKRSRLFVETLCRKYPGVQFIYNLGMYEGGWCTEAQGKTNAVTGMTMRRQFSEYWPKNLHFSPLKSIKINIGDEKYDVMCAFGYPKVVEAVNWEETIWVSTVNAGMTDDHSLFRPAAASEVYHGPYPIRSTIEDINQHHNREEEIIRKWELDYDNNSGYKILITGTSPLKDPLCAGLKYVMYPRIHLYNRLWITSGATFSGTIFRGAKLVSNPGSGAEVRQKLITV